MTRSAPGSQSRDAQPRLELRERLDRADVPTKGQALVPVLVLASLRGLVIRGPMVGRQHAYVPVRDWLGPPPHVDRDRALAKRAQLPRRPRAGDRPRPREVAGLPQRDARAGVAAIANDRPRRCGASLPPPHLLGAFEPVLHRSSGRGSRAEPRADPAPGSRATARRPRPDRAPAGRRAAEP